MSISRDELVNAAQTRSLTGLSNVTIWRSYTGRRTTGEVPFPEPVGYLLGKKVWRRAEVMAWVNAQLRAEAPVVPDAAPVARTPGQIARRREVHRNAQAAFRERLGDGYVASKLGLSVDDAAPILSAKREHLRLGRKLKKAGGGVGTK